MALLVLGVALFAIVHLLKPAMPGVRGRLAGVVGENGAKGVAAVLLIVSVILIAKGWSAAEPVQLWALPLWANHIVVTLMLPAFVLFFGSYPGSAMRARVRHPQLTGFKLWALLHLLVNGDSRSLVLFGGLLAWGVIALIALNRRDGKGPLPAQSANLFKAWGCVLVGIIFWVVILGLHMSLFGVNPLG